MPVEVTEELEKPPRVPRTRVRHRDNALPGTRTGTARELGRQQDADAPALRCQVLGVADHLARLDQDNPCPRRVVRRMLARNAYGTPRPHRHGATQCALKILSCHAAWAQYRRCAGEVDDRGLDTHRTGAAVQHVVDVGAQPVANMSSRRGTDRAETVGRWRRHTATERREQRAGDRMVGHPQRDRLQTAGDRAGNTAAPTKNQGHRARPETVSDAARRVGHLRDPVGELTRPAEVHDQRVRRGPPLHGEDTLHRVDVLRVRAEPVHGLGRERDQPTRAQGASSAFHIESHALRRDAWLIRHHPFTPHHCSLTHHRLARSPLPPRRRTHFETGSRTLSSRSARAALSPGSTGGHVTSARTTGSASPIT